MSIFPRLLQELWKLPKKFVGTELSADDAWIYLLRLFLHKKILMLKHMVENFPVGQQNLLGELKKC